MYRRYSVLILCLTQTYSFSEIVLFCLAPWLREMSSWVRSLTRGHGVQPIRSNLRHYPPANVLHVIKFHPNWTVHYRTIYAYVIVFRVICDFIGTSYWIPPVSPGTNISFSVQIFLFRSKYFNICVNSSTSVSIYLSGSKYLYFGANSSTSAKNMCISV